MRTLTKIDHLRTSVGKEVIMIPVGSSCNREYALQAGIVQGIDRDRMTVRIHNRAGATGFDIDPTLWGYIFAMTEWDE